MNRSGVPQSFYPYSKLVNNVGIILVHNVVYNTSTQCRYDTNYNITIKFWIIENKIQCHNIYNNNNDIIICIIYLRE